MAEIRPFRALRYESAKIALASVATQPYDKITPEMQRAYYERDPANFIRFELPLGAADPYSSAKSFLAQMRTVGVIRVEDRPAMYVYEQAFADPAQPDKSLVRRSLIALGRLHDYSDGVIYRHEQTLTGPKRDREQLLKTTRVQSGLLFMLYDDPARTIEELQPEDTIGEFTDDLSIRQRLWRLAHPATISQIQERFRPLPLFIADGHHRYETALSLRRSREGTYPEDFAMMALVNMRSAGLVVLPTHRTIFDISPQKFADGMRRIERELRATQIHGDAPMADVPSSRFACTVVTASGESWLVDVPREQFEKRFPGRSCELDVEALHTLFEEYFGITSEDVLQQRYVRYHRYPREALQDLKSGAQAAFLIRPVNVATIRDRSLRGALMPQKSTDFYPKMNSGLTLYSWDDSFAAPQGAAQ
jgi:uncharacterized protein (DUF1015 family)